MARMVREASKAEEFAWRNKGYDDANAGRPISPMLKGLAASLRSAYLAGRRCALNEKSKAAAA